MSQATVNPYEIIGTQYAAGLAAIIAALPVSPTIDDLVTAVYNYVQPIYYPVSMGVTVPLQVQTEIKSVANHAINSYINSLVPSGSAMFVPSQFPFIGALIGSVVSKCLPINLTNWIGDVEDNITKTDLTVDEQRPILMATAIGEAAYTYWRTETLAGGGSAWASYFILNNNDYNSIPYWVEASMNGGLCGYGANYQGLVEPNTDRFSTTMISSLIGSLTIAAGKVIFGWIPRITKKLTLNSQTVSALSNAATGTQVINGCTPQILCIASANGTCVVVTPCIGSCAYTCLAPLGGQCQTSAAAAPGGIGACNGCTVNGNTCNGTCDAGCTVTCHNAGTCSPTCVGLNTCGGGIQCMPSIRNPNCVASVNGVVCQNTPVNCIGHSPLPSCNAANCSC